MEVLIRRAGAADAAAASELYTASRSAAGAFLPPPVHTAGEDRWFVREILIAQRDTWLAVEPNGEVAALMSLSPGWIDQLYVRPDLWGRGIGAQLVAQAKSLQPDGLQLWTFESNRGAQRFYERLGFTAVERTDGAGNEEQAPDVRYLWSGAPDPAS
jgi:GNAT superfamily N-acetyltransferase